ncbi:MAG: hypothetical protein ACLFVH_09800 [Phycisphaerae bacterium]
MKPHAIIPAMVLTAALAVGCTQRCPSADTLVPLETLLAEHNRNAAKIPYLRASARYDVTFITEAGLPLPWSSYGYVFYARGEDRLGPHDFALVGKEAGNDVFRMGTSTEDNEYYAWASMGSNRFALIGRLDLAGAPGVEGAAIDPTQLPAILGMSEWPNQRGGLPTMALSMSHLPGEEIPADEQCAYVLTSIARQPISRTILFRRETYIRWDGDPNTPRRAFMVKVFDQQGRRLITASLADYRPIDCSQLESPPDEPPVMPTDIQLHFAPPSAVGRSVKGGYISSMRIRLDELATPDLLYFEVARKRLPASFPPEKIRIVDQHLRSRGQRP